MKLRDLLVLSTTLLALALFVGCQSGSSGGGGGPEDNGMPDENANTDGGPGENANAGGEEDTGDNENETDDENENAADEGNENVADEGNENADDDETTLTEEEAEAVDAAVNSIGDLARLFAALGAGGLPSTDGGPITVNPFTGCPTVTPEGSEEVLGFTIDYGEGCNPVLYPDSTFSGSISGQVNVAARTITLTFNEFVIDGETVEGTVEASVSQDGDLLILESTVDVTFSDGQESATYTGDVTAELNLATGELFIPTADLSCTDQTGDTYAILLDDVHIELIEVLPDAGTATVVLGTVGPGALTVEITFTEDTPTDGTVLVSVNGLPPVALSLEDIEDIDDPG